MQPGIDRGRRARDQAPNPATGLVDFIRDDIQELKRLLFDPRSMQVIMAAMEATWWLNDRCEAWLGERNAADTLTQSAPGNVTSEMGLALLEVADVIRPFPDVVAFLEHVEDEDFLDRLAGLAGGSQARARSRPTSTATACAASARSISRGLAGANVPWRLCP